MSGAESVFARVLGEHEQLGGGWYCSCIEPDDDGRRAPLGVTWEAHIAATLAADLRDDAPVTEAAERVRALIWSSQADLFRDEACRHVVQQPFADNRYVRLLDDLRAILPPEIRS